MQWTIEGTTYRSRAELLDAIEALNRQWQGKRFSPSATRHWNALNEAAEQAERQIREERIRALYEAGAGEPGFVGGGQPAGGGAARSAALATVERYTRDGTVGSTAADRLDRHVRTGDPLGLDARYLEAVGNPAYASAFAKILRDPTHGHLRHEPDEVEAMRVVARAEAQRGMVGGTDSAGGFALPLTLDPSIILTSSGALNPIRQVARVITISTREWQGVSSDAVTAAYQAEEAEVADGTPTLAAPTITAEMGRAFVPVSIELFDDWGALVPELTRLMSEGRDVLDATKFLTGTGTDEPEGVLTGLGVPETLETTGSGAFAIADVWALKAAVGDRFKANSTFAAHPDTLDVVYRFVGAADASEAMMMTGREGMLLGRPAVEWSTMGTGIVAGTKLMLAGDFREGYVIADRIGGTVEVIPHLFGGNQRPTGQRGIFYRWRTGAAVVNPAALRVLVVKA